jgi:meso-butanediol dehydrogenase/(S,S)-butanediol dehydrogenase/diacetyl reductase
MTGVGGLCGRRVLVTGAASGIGAATAVGVAAAGGGVALLDRGDVSAVAARCRKHGGRVVEQRCDVSDPREVEGAFAAAEEAFDGIDAVLHVAGVLGPPRVEVDEIDLADWIQVRSVNFDGAFLVARAAVPRLERTGGALVLTGSGAGVFNGHRSPAYAATKGGLHGLMLALEEPLRARGIRVNALAPGAVRTPMVETALAASGAQPPRRPLTSAEDVANVLVFLASPAADAVRGTIRTW